MPAIKCPNCGRNYSNTLPECPYCKTANSGNLKPIERKTPDNKNTGNTSPIHTRPASQDPVEKPKEDAHKKPAPEAAKPKSENSDAELQEKMKKMQEENERLRKELLAKENEAKSQKAPEEAITKKPENASAKEDAADKKDTPAADENFDKFLNPGKYASEQPKKSDNILNKVSNVLPEGKKTQDIAGEKTKKYMKPPMESLDDTAEEETEEFDEKIEIVKPANQVFKREKPSLKPSPLPKKKVVASPEPEEDEDDDDTPKPSGKEYDPNYDHYYDDVLPELLAEKDRIPKETIIRTAIMIAACVTAVLVAAYRLV